MKRTSILFNESAIISLLTKILRVFGALILLLLGSSNSWAHISGFPEPGFVKSDYSNHLGDSNLIPQGNPAINNNCSGAIQLECAEPIIDHTYYATASGLDAECNGLTSPHPNDLWYSFVADGTSDYIISVATQTDWQGVMFLYTGNCNNFTSSVCQNLATNSTNWGIFNITAPIAGTYYIRIFDYSDPKWYHIELVCRCPEFGPFGAVGNDCDDGNPNTKDDKVNQDCECEGTPLCTSLGLYVGDPCDDGNSKTLEDKVNDNCECVGTSVDNDVCTNAVLLECGQPIIGSSIGATYTNQNQWSCQGAPIVSGLPDVWFSFEADGNSKYTITVSAPIDLSTRFYVYSGSCGNLVNQVCNQGQTTLAMQGLAAGTHYIAATILEPGWLMNPTNFTIELSCVSTNDNCTEAIPLECGNPINGNTFNASASGLSGNCGGPIPNPLDVWYTFESNGIATYTVTVSGTEPGFDGVMYLYTSGDCGEFLMGACSNDAWPNSAPESITLAGLDSGTYYVRVFNHSGTSSFNIELTCTCPNLGLNIGASCNDGDPGTVLETVNDSCECVGKPIPENDDCLSAVTLQCGQPISGFTFGATNSGLNTECSGYQSMDARDVWYKFEADGSSDYTVTVSTTASDWDGVVFLYSGDCNNLILEACADNVSPPSDSSESITFELLPAGTYYVRTFDYFGVSFYTIKLTCKHFDCPDLRLNLGAACDDGDPFTVHDKLIANCECAGTPTPVNDFCSGAIPITCSQFIEYEGTGGGKGLKNASASGVPLQCTGSFNDIGEPEDIWYSFEANGISNYYINDFVDYQPGSGGLIFAVYSGDCDNLVKIYCDRQNTLITGLTAGTYYIRIRSIYEVPWFIFELQCICPSGDKQGKTCDDGDLNTINDKINDNCECAGTRICPSDNILYVNANATGENDGFSWTNAFNNLQDALNLNCTDVSQIWVAKGTYMPPVNTSFTMKNGVAIYGGFDDTGNPGMEDRDWNAYPTILKGNGNRVINNNFTSEAPLLSGAELNGFTITEGSVTGQSQSGAGIYNNYASPVLTNLIISGNNAGWNGGGIFNNYSSPVLTNVIISGNKATWGGGVYNNNSSFPVLTNVTISGNNAISAGGGGGVINVNSSPVIRNSIIYGNSHGVIDFGGNSFSDISYSLVQGLNVENNGNVSGAKNPMFVSAPTFNTAPFTGGDYRLISSSSPAFNKGNNAFYNADSIPDLSAITTDFDGEPRIQNGTVDLGAYENNGCPSGNILYVNVNAIGENNGSSWTDAYTGLQDALSLTCDNVDQIWVAAGTYYPDQGGGNSLGDRNATFTMKNNLTVYGGFAGTETSLSQRDLAVNPTILSGDIGVSGTKTDNTYNVVTGTGTDNSAVLDGFTITEGYAVGGNGRGGGLHNGDNSSPKIINCIFKNNYAEFAGAIYNRANNNGVYINCLIYNNDALYYSGGMHNVASASVTITNCTFSGNAKEAIRSAGNAPIITNSIIWGNSTGIYGSATVSYSIVQGGYAGVGNLNLDPLFSDGGNKDYRLQLESPALDAGNDAANTESIDLNGNSRKLGTIDMGAYENQKIPSNDACANAVTLIVNEFGNCPEGEISGTTIGATSESISAFCEPENPDVFYTFNSGTNSQVLINLGTLDSDIDVVLTVSEESCEGQEIKCELGTGSYIAEVIPMTNYIVRVSSNISFGITGDFTICIETTYTATLNGSVAWNSNCGERDATVKLYEPGTATEVASYAVSVQSDGSFTIPNLGTGTFDVIVKVTGYLAKGTRNVEITAGNNSLQVGTIRFGDLNGANVINFLDAGALSQAYFTSTGNPNYNPIADFDCNGAINFLDAGALSQSYFKEGDKAPLVDP